MRWSPSPFATDLSKTCMQADPAPACSGNADISHISDDEMKNLMKSAVNALYRLLWLREHDPVAYNENLTLGRRYTLHWDDPELKKPVRKGSRPK